MDKQALIESLQAELDEINGLAEITTDDIDRRNTLMNRIAELEWEMQQTVQHEERIKQSVEQIVTTWDEVEIHGLPLRSLFADEKRYQLASIWFKEQLAAQAEGLSEQVQFEQREVKAARDAAKELESKIEAKESEIGQLRLENAQLEQYRQNAASMIREKDEEIKRLEDKIQEQRDELALGVRGAIRVTNLDGGKELAEQIKASLIPVLSIDKVSSNTIRLTHPDGAITEDNWLAKGKYRVIDQEEAARFLAEQANKIVEESATSNPALVDEPEVPTFQVPQTPTADGLDDGDVGRTLEDGKDQGVATAALEERVAALEAWRQRVEGQLIPANAYKDGAA